MARHPLRYAPLLVLPYLVLVPPILAARTVLDSYVDARAIPPSASVHRAVAPVVAEPTSTNRIRDSIFRSWTTA